uniref:Clip domain-containing protein n=1 Tax=Dendroctonus ponderosae TaxID=77166 RepID=A0AAR5PE85_DENPD
MSFSRIFVRLLLLSLGVLIPITSGNPTWFRICRPDQDCIRLTDCTSYMNFIRNIGPLTKASIAFLKQQECGFDGSFPKVCCFHTRLAVAGSSQNSEQSTTARVEFTTKPAGRGSNSMGSEDKPAFGAPEGAREHLKKKKMEALNEAFAQMDFFMFRQH